ncbi:MAG: J domain-containing protein [Rhodocyclaceae bacterium]|nr:J domain-containing protein [Rhodocyclaceae bacterium]
MPTLPLFPDLPESPPGALKTLNIATGGQALTKDQKRFNSLLKQIEAARKFRDDWESAIGAFRDFYLRQIVPRDEEIHGLQEQFLLHLDNAWETFKLTRPERKKVQQIAVDECLHILARDDQHETAKALYNKFTNGDYDDDFGGDDAALREMMESLLADFLPNAEPRGGPAPGDDFDPFDPANHDSEGRIRPDADPVKPRKKTAQQLARDARQEEEQKQLGQSLKDIYRKLASSLHPDREPDATERARKTELMQQANEAYEQRNLLQLLELQLQVDHVDAARLAAMSDERLKRYNLLLKQQLESMTQAADQMVYEFLDQYGLDAVGRNDTQEPMRLLRLDLRTMSREIADMKKIIAAVEHPAGLKTYLKTVRRARRSDPFF